MNQFANLTGEALTAALPTALTDIAADALSASLADAKASFSTLIALETPTVAQVNDAEALVASIKDMEAEQASRAEVKRDAAKRFKALQASVPSDEKKDGEPDGDESDTSDEKDKTKGKPKPFSVDDEAIDPADAEGDEGDEGSEDEGDEGSEDEGSEGDEGEGEGDAAVTASAKAKPGSAARNVGRRGTRPATKAVEPITITAAADVPEFSMGSQMKNGMTDVAKALINRTQGFAPFNARAAEMAREASGGEPVLNKFGVASFGLNFDPSMVASNKSGDDNLVAIKAALKREETVVTASMSGGEEALTAAGGNGWCAPSQPVYTFMSDHVVDGLLTMGEVSAPRGGLLITTGPRVAGDTQGAALDDFGFSQTEAENIAGKVKDCEVIECPDFVDHRLEAVGYCYKIPILMNTTYPEVVKDALSLASTLHAHKMNRRFINDIVGLSPSIGFEGYGPSFTDTLEALSLIATSERRAWSVGVNFVMKVVLPQWVQEVFRADISRRNSMTVDSVSDAQIAQHFTDRRLNVEYVSDWQELRFGPTVTLPGKFTALIYPEGTFVKAVQPVINLSAVYDAASLSVNEYTGVFFEQAVMTAQVGYGSHKVDIGINTAGEMGALTLMGKGDKSEAGSF